MSSIQQKAIRIIEYSLRKFGIDIARYKKKFNDPFLPRIFDDPIEALCSIQGGGETVAFECPLDKAVHRKGFRWGSPKGWHPFVESLREYEAGNSTCYDDSILKSYYEKHRPEAASDALIGFDTAPDVFHEYPPYGYRLSPWRSNTIHDIEKIVKHWTNEDNKEHGRPEITFSSGGKKIHGPVSREKGKLEYRRLTSVYDSIKENGYIHSEGYPHVRVLKRNDEYLFRPVRRKHRIAAMAALGYDSVPALYDHLSVVDITMVNWWPQVIQGVWSSGQAKQYFDYLFDFDSRAWAWERGLLFDQRRRQ